MGKTDVNVMTGTKVPALRFKGFNDEWVEKKLGDVLSYEQPTKYIVESDNYDDSNDIPVLTAGKSFVLGYTDEVDGVYDKGDVILFDDFTTATQLVDFEFKVKSSAMKLLTPNNDGNINFMYELLNKVQYPHDDHKRYWISEFATLKSNMPTKDVEQNQIGEVFKTVDALIQSDEQKLEQLQSLKKSFLQKMFPKKGATVPELRFDGFSGDWAETQILDEIRAYQPKTLPQSEFTGAGYPVYGANGIIGYTDKYNHDFEQIALACRGTVGSVIRTEKKSWINGNAMVLDVSDNDSVDFDFMYHLLGQYNFNRLATGSTQLQITRASLLGAKFYMPSLQEQQAIGQFFKTFDELIAKQEEKVENGKLLKKALLQKMFV